MTSEESDRILRAALEEDLAEAGDITSQATVEAEAVASAIVVARSPGCIAGIDLALRVFQIVDDGLAIEASVDDGAVVPAGARLGRVTGRARSLLAAERVALNFLAHLSGVATATRALVDRVEGTGATIMETRKTTPGLRVLEKMAVRAGGGRNHRLGLFDAVLIKDNHIAAVGSVGEAVRKARAHVGDDIRVEVEIDRIDQLAELDLPTLFVVGEYDEIPVETVLEFRDLVPGSIVEIIDDAGHMVHIDGTAQLNGAVSEFLAGIDPS